jgi:hypothetical protein
MFLIVIRVDCNRFILFLNHSPLAKMLVKDKYQIIQLCFYLINILLEFQKEDQSIQKTY